MIKNYFYLRLVFSFPGFLYFKTFLLYKKIAYHEESMRKKTVINPGGEGKKINNYIVVTGIKKS